MYSKDQIRQACKLYAVTDNTWLYGRTLADCVAAAIAGGATFVQLRDKAASTEERIVQAQELLPLCRNAHVPFVIDDDIEAARAVGADGVHVGQEDMACAQARALLGNDAIVGVSVHTLSQAHEAESAGADYVGVGALIPTSTKPDANLVSRDELCEICAAVSIPVVGIGGLNPDTISCLAHTGVAGAAVVSAIFAADDIEEATQRLVACLAGMLKEAC